MNYSTAFLAVSEFKDCYECIIFEADRITYKCLTEGGYDMRESYLAGSASFEKKQLIGKETPDICKRLTLVKTHAKALPAPNEPTGGNRNYRTPEAIC